MANQIPDGYELLSGRSRESARAALALAEERGLDVQTVLTVGDGFLVPLGDSVADESPTEKNTVAEIEDWANAHDIDLSGANTKAEKVAAISDSLNADSKED